MPRLSRLYWPEAFIGLSSWPPWWVLAVVCSLLLFDDVPYILTAVPDKSPCIGSPDCVSLKSNVPFAEASKDAIYCCKIYWAFYWLFGWFRLLSSSTWNWCWPIDLPPLSAKASEPTDLSLTMNWLDALEPGWIWNWLLPAEFPWSAYGLLDLILLSFA